MNLDLVHLTACPPWANTMEKVADEIKKLKADIAKHERLHILKSGKELDNVISDGKTAVILGLQHLPEDANVRWLRELGIRITTLSFDGWKNQRRLSDVRKQFIKDCGVNGIIVDLSHSNHHTARDVVELIGAFSVETSPSIIASHTSCFNVYPHRRNLTSSILSDIAHLGGIVGISAVSFFLNERDNSLKPFFEHLKEMIDVCGNDRVCIGSDMPYVRRKIGEWRKSAETLQSKLDTDGTMGARFPDFPLELNCADKASVIKREMEELHYDSITISNIIGNNFYNFVKENL